MTCLIENRISKQGLGRRDIAPRRAASTKPGTESVALQMERETDGLVRHHAAQPAATRRPSLCPAVALPAAGETATPYWALVAASGSHEDRGRSAKHATELGLPLWSRPQAPVRQGAR